MPGTPFRSVETWQSSLMTLSEDSYFELLRNALGNIKTPFNKQRLMEDLTAFLSREDIRQRIARYINETDGKILTAVSLLEEPTAQDLEKFFAGEFSPLELHEGLINLEDRFILYRIQEEGRWRLSLNPLLEPALTPFMGNESLLFPWFPLPPASGDSEKLPLEDRIFAGLVAFALERGELFRAEGKIRRKILEEGSRLFPGLDLPLMLQALQCLGLLKKDPRKPGFLGPDPAKLRAFQRISSRERLEFCAAALYLSREDLPALPPLWHVAGFIHQWLTLLEPEKHYPRITLERFAELLRQTRVQGNLRLDFLLQALEITGLLESSDSDRWNLRIPGSTPNSKPGLVMDMPFSFVLYPEVSFADALDLAYFSAFRGIGAAARFELTRQSVIQGFDRGINAEAILTLLNRLSGNRLDPNLEWTLKDWERRYAAVSLYQGVVLTLAEDRRYLAETGPLRTLVARTLAPGVYLLSVPEQAQAAEALQKAGIDIVAQQGLWGSAESSVPRDPYQFSPVKPLKLAQSSGGFMGDQGEALKEHFRGILQTTSLSPGERDALSKRIDRRLILDAAQLTGGSLRYEKLEARGLDYVGKASLAKQAIAARSLVEVSLPQGEKVVGIPEALEKWGGESVLFIKPQGPGEPEAIRLPLGKIGLLRRIKPSIFGA